MSQGARNCPFLTFTTFPVAAAASRRSVCRHRNAGICSTSTACATSAHCAASWISVRTGNLRVSRISAKIGSDCFRPMPRAPAALVRLALSKEVLYTSPIFKRTAISFSAPAISGATPRSLHRRKRRRGEELVDDVVDDLSIRLGFRARLDPCRIGHEGRPLLLALGQGVPGQKIGELLVGFADERGEKAGLLDAVLFPQLQRDGVKALQKRRQPARQATIDAHFVDHPDTPLCFCSCGRGGVLSQQTGRSSKAG